MEDIFPWQNKKANQDPSPIKIGDEFKNKAIENLPKEGDIFQKDPLSNNIPGHTAAPESLPREEQDMSSSVRRSDREWKPSTTALESFTFCTLLGKENVVFSSETNGEPRNYSEAMDSEAKAKWQGAIDSEIESHLKNGTLQPCDLPPGRKAVPLAWVLKVKTNPDGTKRHKARIVMKGFLQKEGVDYVLTFAPVAKWSSIRIVLALATILDWNLAHIDFETAFMIPKMDAEVYVKVTDGMQALSSTGFAKMLKGVNGCKQGAKLFYDEVKGSLLRNGFVMSIYDSCVFIKRSGTEICIVVVWVDDFLISSNGSNLLKELFTHLARNYKFKLFHEPTLFLGVKLSRDRSKKTMQISQRDYLADVLQRFGMEKCNPIPTPMEPSKFFAKKVTLDKDESKYMADKPYRSLACSLMYSSNISRPDIAYACNAASRHLQLPGKEHWKLLKRISRYIKGTIDLCLNFSADSTEVTGWPDASWADNLDDRKSTGAYLIFIGSCLVSWSSKKQGYIALSSNNAELGALSEVCREAYFVRGLLNELSPDFLPVSKPIKIYEDNEGTISQANNNVMNNASRTIALKFHFVREEIDSKRIILISVTSHDQLGDLLTKQMAAPQFQFLRNRVMGYLKWETLA